MVLKLCEPMSKKKIRQAKQAEPFFLPKLLVVCSAHLFFAQSGAFLQAT